jgi:hypothetical protein
VKTVLKGWLGCAFVIVWGCERERETERERERERERGRRSQGVLFSMKKIQILISKTTNHCFSFFKP